jgi:ATP-binding cassette, subfamily F, member 3
VAVLIANGLRKEIAGSPLFENVSFKVERRDRLALAGPNGAGKTTLLRALAGETDLQGGELAFAKGTRIALHDQRPPIGVGSTTPIGSAGTGSGAEARSDRTLREYVLAGAADLVALEDELRRLEQAMATGDHGEQTLRRYSATQGRLEHAGGYDWRERAAAVLRGLGFTEDDLDRPLRTFSGGELTRASLGRALGGDPDLLLLDEPTNHLDVESLEWLEERLTTIDAAVILVAHDRWFLEATTTATLELLAGKSTFFPGPWHMWRREQAARIEHAAKTADRVAADIERLERFVERFRYKKSKAKQAQAKLRQIGRLDVERREASQEHALLTRRAKALGFEFLKPARSGRTVVEARGLKLEAGGKQLLDGVEFAIERGEHVALVGPNGSGKTTLIETMMGKRPAAAGTVRMGHGVEAAYFSQHEVELDERGSVLDCAVAMTGLRRPDAQNLLGRFLFSGWDAHEKAVAVLSGGERRRLALACLVASGSNFLVLDEPTNHLDLESREALEQALEAFPGTVLLVSHDRALLDAVAHRLLAVEDRQLVSSDGGWADYVATREERNAVPAPAAPVAPKRQRPARPAKPKASPLELLEAEIARTEQRLAELEQKLAADWSDVELLSAHRSARDDLQALLERWECLFEQAGA